MNLAGKLVFAVLAAACVLSAQESREVRKTVTLSKDGRVAIDTYKGSVTVETWDKREVEIVATIEVDERDRYAEEKVRDTEIRISDSPGSVRITTDYDRIRRRSSGFWGLLNGDTGSLPFVHYSIKMPATADLKIKDYKSDTDVRNLRGKLDLNTYKGTVQVAGLEGGIDLETYKGRCRIEFASFSSRSSFETYKGDIALVLPQSAAFTLDADMGRRGDFDSDFSTVSSTRWRKRTSYDGSVNGGGPLLRLRTDKGEFRLLSR